MYAIVANGYQGIVDTKRELDLVISIYPYPKFRKFNDRDAAIAFLRRYTRKYAYSVKEYGDTYKRGFATLEYFIVEDGICANLHTNKLGNVFMLNSSDDVIFDKRPDFYKIKVKNVKLNDSLIRHHIIAIKRLLKIVGPVISICVVVPDISIYLALTSYKGKDNVIVDAQRTLSTRLGGVSYTIREG